MKKIVLFIMLLSVLWGCTDAFLGEQPKQAPRDTFEYLWEEIRTKYSYLGYKEVDWDSVYTKYSPLIRPDMSQEALFRVLADMMNELRDGHVNLMSPFTYSVYYPIFLGRPENYDGRLLLERYLLRDIEQYFITGPFQHTVLDTLGKRFGLITYRSFSSGFSSADLNFVFQKMANVDGVILDLRSNGGGAIQNAHNLAGRFTDVERIGFYSRLKSGPNPEDFGPEQAVRVIPAASPLKFTGNMAVLTNRGSYSATSMFCLHMRALPNIRLIGDTTGGGLGVPNGGELPNGWTYRFSVSQSLSPETNGSGQRFNWESGVPPHIQVDLDAAQAALGFDSMLERALLYLESGQ